MAVIDQPSGLFSTGYYTASHHTDQTAFDSATLAGFKTDRFYIELSHDPSDTSKPTPTLVSSGTMSFNDGGTVGTNADVNSAEMSDVSSGHIEPLTGTQYAVGDFTATTDTGITYEFVVYPRLIGLRFDSYQGSQEGSPVVGYIMDFQNNAGAAGTYFFPTSDQDLSAINLPYPVGQTAPGGYSFSQITHYDSLDDGDGIGSGTYVAYGDLYDGLPSQFTGAVCFAAGSLIHTISGQRPVQDLRIGDLVWTADHGYQPIRWIGASPLRQRDLRERETLRPIRIPSGALGNFTPDTDLVVSPQHRMYVKSSVAAHLCGASEILIPAKDLVGYMGITRVDDLMPVTYYHIMFDQHQIIMANGCLTESFYVGAQALRALSPAGLEELMTLFPELMSFDGFQYHPARPFVKGQKARSVIAHHVTNRIRIAA